MDMFPVYALVFVLVFVIWFLVFSMGDGKFPFQSLSVIGLGLMAGAGGIWLVSGVETWSASSVVGSMVFFVFSIMCLLAGYLRLTKKTMNFEKIKKILQPTLTVKVKMQAGWEILAAISFLAVGIYLILGGFRVIDIGGSYSDGLYRETTTTGGITSERLVTGARLNADMQLIITTFAIPFILLSLSSFRAVVTGYQISFKKIKSAYTGAFIALIISYIISYLFGITSPVIAALLSMACCIWYMGSE